MKAPSEAEAEMSLRHAHKFRQWRAKIQQHDLVLDVGRNRVAQITQEANRLHSDLVSCRVFMTGETFSTNFENLRRLTPIEALAHVSDL